MAATEFAAAGDTGTDRSSVGFLVDQWVASRTDIASKTKMQYEWAAGHIRSGLGSIRVDRLDRSDVAQWLDELAAGGKMGRRSISIFRMVLRARSPTPSTRASSAGAPPAEWPCLVSW